MSKDAACILYGSQTGNAESISKILCEEIIKKTGMDCVYDTLNNSVNISFDVVKYIIVVCSTTGNGDMPDNSIKWWRQFKQPNTNKCAFEGIHFLVLALGNSNYSKFCYCGKILDKRLAEMSGTRMMELTCVDDATDMDEHVEIWIHKVLTVLRNIV